MICCFFALRRRLLNNLESTGLYLYLTQPLLLSDLAVREASRLANKDVGPIDESCFQLVIKDEVITLRANSASEKRQWIKQISDAIKQHNNRAKSGNAKRSAINDTVGTLKFSILEARNLALTDKSKCEIFCVVELEHQSVKSQKRDSGKHINQAMMFSVSSLDLNISISVYKHSEYSSDGILH
jgi:Pleckstrin homology domain/C2 domain